MIDRRLKNAQIFSDTEQRYKNDITLMVDARNTARLFRKIKTEVELKLNPYYVVNERPFDSGISLGALLAGLAI